MKNRFDEKVKGHGFFRKTKAFGLASGIALGAALLIGANTVSADEALQLNQPQLHNLLVQILRLK